jgi:hypothetical protein
MTKKEEKLVEQETDPIQQKYEREALEEQAKLEKKAEKGAYLEPQAAEAMPQRFSTGGATYDDKVAWEAAHGGAAPAGAAIEPGYAEAKDVAPQ